LSSDAGLPGGQSADPLQMPVFRYDEEEWEHLVEADPGWSRAETDYLLDMCERFELRFLVIADRYEVGMP